MENERFNRGLNKLIEYTMPDGTEATPPKRPKDPLDDIAPDFRNYIIEFAYGDIYCRPGLDNKERALITISSLVTQGTDKQIEVHINRGLTAGLSPEQVVESIIQLIPYTGFPRTQNALVVAKKVFEQRNLLPMNQEL